MSLIFLSWPSNSFWKTCLMGCTNSSSLADFVDGSVVGAGLLVLFYTCTFGVL